MMSEFDKDNIAAIMQGHGTWFTAELLRLCAKADAHNLERIAKGFPDEVTHYLMWRNGVTV